MQDIAIGRDWIGVNGRIMFVYIGNACKNDKTILTIKWGC